MGHGGISSGIVRYPTVTLCNRRTVGLEWGYRSFTFYEFRVSSTLG